MKRAFFLLLAVFFVAASCEKEVCGCVPSPEGADLHGTWEFVRASYGFTNQTVTAKDRGYTETLKITADTKVFVRYKDDKIVESTDLKFSTQGEVKTLVFKKDNTYSPYTIFMEDGKLMLSLYERSPVGAVLADGGMYYYEKK